ncbi:transposase [Erwinia tracheiphila]|uniref:Transposase n=1 Tax=Erwinia tracheiphila TaxID=65700 RepID=A0A0M2K9Y2_9GAMM|nr:transposase [Erwinia tracheiphila]
MIRRAFKCLHYPVDIIAQCVRWSLTYSLSLRNLEEMMVERGIMVHPSPEGHPHGAAAGQGVPPA